MSAAVTAPAAEPRKLPILSTSEVKAYRACPRRHQIGYRLGYRAISRGAALAFGSLFHAALEVWWRTVDLSAALVACDGTVDAAPPKTPIDPFDRAKARALLIGYHARWSQEPLEVLRVEQEFEIPLVNPATGAASKTYAFAGKVDAIVRLPDGRVAVVEHKTSGEDCEPGSVYWKRLRLDAQIANYLAGVRALGLDASDCLYDVIRKPTLRPYEKTAELRYKKDGQPYAGQRLADETPDEYEARILADIAERPDRYYVRAELPRLGTELEDAAHDLWGTARAIRESELSDRWPRNPDACVQYGRTCDYFAVCTGEASLDDPTRYRRITRRHEELSR